MQEKKFPERIDSESCMFGPPDAVHPIFLRILKENITEKQRLSIRKNMQKKSIFFRVIQEKTQIGCILSDCKQKQIKKQSPPAADVQM